MNMNKCFVLGIAALSLISSAVAANRVGPVSQYGQLQVGKNAQGKGRIYGSCPAYSAPGHEVAVQGMSLFWSMEKNSGINFWNSNVIKGLVDTHKIQLIRAPMGVDGSWYDDLGNYYTNSRHEEAMNTVVQAAIDNDIYVIIDYHSHCAENNTNGAAQFFGKMAQKWGNFDNVIFEIYNEPKHGDCNENNPWYDADEAKNYWKKAIYPYASTVISEIRKYSDNLVVVGTPYYDQYVDAALVQPINDKNVAYTFHYYAGEELQNSDWTHKVDVLGKNPEALMEKGYSVFVTEWGNSGPSGDGGFNASYSTTWYNWVKQHQLSGANWSVSNKDEDASYFKTWTNESTPASQWSYTESGEWTNTNVFASLPASYKACDKSAPAASSSSVMTSSPSVAQSSSSMTQPASSATVVSGDLKISGSLEQTVAKGGSVDAISIEGITSYSRSSWHLHFLGIPDQVQGGKLTISGTIPDYIQEGTLEESFTINGQPVKITLNIVAAGTVTAKSSSSTKPVASSSSKTQALTAQNTATFKVAVSGRTLQVTGYENADVNVFDFQGRPLAAFKNVRGAVNMEALPSGNYIVQVRAGSQAMIKRISLK